MSRIRVQQALEITEDWVVNHAPGNNAQATASRAAQPGKRNVCTGIVAIATSVATAPAAKVVRVSLRDGTTGAGTVLWGPHPIGIQATAGVTQGISHLPCYIEGSGNTAMTLEFDAAGGNNTECSVTLEGTTIPA